MARYHVDNDFGGTKQNLSTGYKTLTALWAVTATLCRGRAVGLAVAPVGAPNATDCNIIYAVQRQTADGTATATATPNPIIPGDVASRSVSKVNYTAEGTYTLPIWARSLNQRTSMQWLAPDIDAMLAWPATNLAGLACVAKGADSTFTTTAFFGLDYEDL